jgi:hypothetical protein
MSGTTNSNGVNYDLSLAGIIPFQTYTLVITYPAGGGSPTTITGIPTSNVLTTNGGTLTAVSLLSTENYVIPPNLSGTIDFFAAVAGTQVVYVGGTATIDSTVSVLSGVTINVDGGSATVASGVLASALSGSIINLDNGGAFSNGNALAAVLNGTTINFGANGGTFVANAGGTLLNLSSTTINGFSSTSDKIEFENLIAPLDHYNVSAPSGGSQTITLYSSNGTDLGSVTVAGTSLAAGTVFQGQSGPLTVSESGDNVTLGAGTSVFTCFLAGTRILTPRGEVAIEDLQAGDLVVTANGEAMEIKDLAVNRTGTRFVDPAQVMPVKISAGAFGDALPARDLYVSPDHSFYFDGVLVPAQLLINGSTIRQISRPGPIDYYHIELDPHALIIAEGVATESFLDTGVQWRRSAQRVVNLLPNAEPKTWEDACAPLVLSGPQLDAIRAALQERAVAIAGSGPATVAA